MKSLIALLGMMAVLGTVTESVADEPATITVAMLTKPVSLERDKLPNLFERPAPPPNTTRKDQTNFDSWKFQDGFMTGRSDKFPERIEQVLRVMKPAPNNVRGNLFQVFLLSPPQPNVTSDNYNPYTDKVVYEVRYTITRRTCVVVNGSEGIWYEVDAERHRR